MKPERINALKVTANNLWIDGKISNQFVEQLSELLAEVETIGSLTTSLNEMSVGLSTLKSENESLRKAAHQNDYDRLIALANLIWETRWVSEESDYQSMVGIAAEIVGGNFNGIDGHIKPAIDSAKGGVV